MIGALIGDLAAWTWEHEHDKFYPQLFSDNAQLSEYGHAMLRAASRNVISDSSIDTSPTGSPKDGLRYYGQALMWYITEAWMDDDIGSEYSQPVDMPTFYSEEKQMYYAQHFLSRIIKMLRTGASKTETFNSINQFNGFIKHWNWKTDAGDKSILCHLFRAWDCFYRGFDLTSCLHNAQKWTGDRTLTSVLTGAIAGTMYGSDSMYLKKKYARANDFMRFLIKPLVSSSATSGYDKDLVSQMRSMEERKRPFFPKNNALTNVELHHYTETVNPFEKISLSDLQYRKIIKAFYTDFDHRYGFYLDDGWIYSYRSTFLIGRFKMARHEDGWRMEHLQLSGERPFKDLCIAVCRALTDGCRIFNDALYNIEGTAFLLKYYDGYPLSPKDSPTKGKFWHGEMMFVSQNINLQDWSEKAKDVRQRLKGNQKTFADKYVDSQLGIVLYIETLYSKWCPYDNLDWIYEY